MLRAEWDEMLAREGVTPVACQAAADPDGEPPCPACGTTAPLVAGVCSDCGLQLE